MAIKGKFLALLVLLAGLTLGVSAHELAPPLEQQKLSELLATIGVKPGDSVAEVTSGIGFRLQHFVEAVGPKGVVYGIAFHQENVDKIREKATQNNWNNVRPTLGSHVGEEVNLPDGEMDWVVVLDSYHHFRPAKVLANLKKSLGPNGRMVIVKVYTSREHPTVSMEKLRPHVRLDRGQVIAQVQKHGFVLETHFDQLPYQYVATFRKE